MHVKHTWGKRCDVLLFMSSVKNDTFPTIGLNVSEGRNHLVAKVMQGFQYVAANYFDAADWFMKADDDTYVIMENLRHFLSKENSEKPIVFGSKFMLHVGSRQQYFTGGPGYILSKAALRRFAEATKNKTSNNPRDGTTEDIKISSFLHRIGVQFGNSTDSSGRTLFHHFPFENYVIHKYSKMAWEKQIPRAEVVSI